MFDLLVWMSMSKDFEFSKSAWIFCLHENNWNSVLGFHCIVNFFLFFFWNPKSSSFPPFFVHFLLHFLQDFLGQMFCTLGEIVGSPASRLEKPLGWVSVQCSFLMPPDSEWDSESVYCTKEEDGTGKKKVYRGGEFCKQICVSSFHWNDPTGLCQDLKFRNFASFALRDLQEKKRC